MTLPPHPLCRYSGGVPHTSVIPRPTGNNIGLAPTHPMLTAEIDTETPPLDLRAIPGTWGLACCKTREEKAVSERLKAQGIGHYLPLLTERRPYGTRVKELELAACPGYLFVAWEHDWQFSALWSTRGLYDVRREPRQRLMVEQMCDLQTVLASEHFRKMDRWRKGQPVQIRQGHNLAGMRGWLASERTSNMIQFGYPLWGQVAVAEVDAVFIELVDAASVVAA